jgi:nucleoside-diphosphate-sugar epimerase
MATVLLTGAAGFIGMHVAEALLARGDRVLGLDSLTPYYDVRLKRARLARLEGRRGSNSCRSTSPTAPRCCRWPRSGRRR